MKRKEKYNLTRSQEMYAEYLMQGYSQRKAYILAYPEAKDMKPSTVDLLAYKLFHTADLKKRYDELCEIRTEENIKKAIWTREMALGELKNILENNKKEYYRYEEAYIDEITMYDKQINERTEMIEHPKTYLSKKRKAEIEQEIDQLKMAKIKCNRRWQSNKSVNEAILQSVVQMNSMLGFNEKEEKKVEVQAQVIFQNDIPENDEDLNNDNN